MQRQSPHDGSRRVGRGSVALNNLDEWALQLAVPVGFEAEPRETPVRGSNPSTVATSVGRKGRRRAIIVKATEQSCAVIVGGGAVVRCGTCAGRGQTYQTRSEQRSRACRNSGSIPKFHGTGYDCRGGRDQSGNVCRNCNGSGIEYYIHREQYPVTCITCSGQGQHQCQSCGGGGAVTCENCHGQGHFTCSSCQGHKRLVDYLAVIQSYEVKEGTTRNNTRVWLCPEEAIHTLDPALDFSELLNRMSIVSGCRGR